MNSMKRLFYQVKHGIENLIIWFPIIWKDRDFDYAYLLDIAIFKTKKMLSFFESKKCMTDWNEEYSKKDLDALKKLIPLLEYIRDEKYKDDAFEGHYKKFPVSFDFLEENGNKVMSPMTKEERKSFRQAMKISESNYRKAMKEMDNFVLNHLRGWWD